MWGTSFLMALVAGARHAVEPDHLAAVSTLVTDVRRGGRGSVRRALVLGLSWGLGHMAALVALTAALFLLRAQVSARLDDVFELAVAVVLLVLGGRALARAVAEGRRGPATLHAHAHGAHAHPGPAGHLHLGRVTLAARPLVVGVIHGLAGSGTLVAVAVGALPSFAAALAALAVFGIGATATMAVAAAGGAVAGRLLEGPRARVALAAAAGLLSVGMGLAKGWPLTWRLLAG